MRSHGSVLRTTKSKDEKTVQRTPERQELTLEACLSRATQHGCPCMPAHRGHITALPLHPGGPQQPPRWVLRKENTWEECIPGSACPQELQSHLAPQGALTKSPGGLNLMF